MKRYGDSDVLKPCAAKKAKATHSPRRSVVVSSKLFDGIRRMPTTHGHGLAEIGRNVTTHGLSDIGRMTTTHGLSNIGRMTTTHGPTGIGRNVTTHGPTGIGRNVTTHGPTGIGRMPATQGLTFGQTQTTRSPSLTGVEWSRTVANPLLAQLLKRKNLERALHAKIDHVKRRKTESTSKTNPEVHGVTSNGGEKRPPTYRPKSSEFPPPDQKLRKYTTKGSNPNKESVEERQAAPPRRPRRQPTYRSSYLHSYVEEVKEEVEVEVGVKKKAPNALSIVEITDVELKIGRGRPRCRDQIPSNDYEPVVKEYDEIEEKISRLGVTNTNANVIIVEVDENGQEILEELSEATSCSSTTTTDSEMETSSSEYEDGYDEDEEAEEENPL